MLTNGEKAPDGGTAVMPEHECKIFEREAKVPLGHIDRAPQINSSVDRIFGRLTLPLRKFEEVIELHLFISLYEPLLWIRYRAIEIAVRVLLLVHLFNDLVGARCRILVRQQFNPRLNAVVL